MTEVIIVSGVLGAGKTTVLNRLIPGIYERMIRVASIENDIGRINFDSAALSMNPEDVFGYSSGCVCCERREDLEKILNNINIDKYDMLLVEPTGAANPIEIIGTIQDYQHMTLKHVLNVVPLPYFHEIKTKRSFNAGLQSANIIILNPYRNRPENLKDNERSLERHLHKLNVTSPLEYLNGAFSLATLERFPAWAPKVFLDDNEHEHYNRITRPLNPSLSLDEVLKIVQEISAKGVERIKGMYVGKDGTTEFQTVRGQLYHGPARFRVAMPFINVISSTEIPIDMVRKLEGTYSEKIPFAMENATQSDLAKTFHYYFTRAENSSASVNGVVQANFEAPDEAYTAAKAILLKYGDSNPMKMALVPYIGIRLEALDELENSRQNDRAYVGVMLCSFVIQMLGTHDEINFNDLTEPDQLKDIKEKACRRYFNHLSVFGDADFERVRNYDAYSLYFNRMARQAVPYAVETRIACENMRNVYERNGKADIAHLWNELCE